MKLRIFKNKFEKVYDEFNSKIKKGLSLNDICIKEGPYYIYTYDKKYRYIILNEKLRPIINQVFDEVGCYSHNLLLICVGKKFNFIDKDCNYLSNEWFCDAYNFSNGYAVVRTSKGANYIDTNGKFLFDKWFGACFEFSTKRGLVVMDDGYNFIDRNGNFFYKESFKECEPLDGDDDNFAKVKVSGVWKKINPNGEFLE